MQDSKTSALSSVTMLDYFCIFTKSGALLWALSMTAVKGNPVNALIKECLLEERAADSSFFYTAPNGTAYTLKWSLNNVRAVVECLGVEMNLAMEST